MQVSLFKKSGTYTNKEGEEKKFTNFYVRCGDALISVEPCYFPNKETGKDNQYSGRKEVLKAFAEELPEKGKTADIPVSEEEKGKKPQLQPFPDDDSGIPF